MSFCVVRMAKFKGAAVGGLQNHDTRARESQTNPDIDKAASENNYSLQSHDMTMREAINARTQELAAGKKIRKDAVTCCGMLVTSDTDFFKGLPAERQREFFKDSYEFLKDRYGEKNVVSATVHTDEKTPHMHFYFVPECDGRLSAKDLFALPKRELEHLQTDFAREVGQKYGLERGIEGSPAKHISVTRHKALEAEERLKKAQEEYRELAPELEKVREEKQHRRDLQPDSLGDRQHDPAAEIPPANARTPQNAPSLKNAVELSPKEAEVLLRASTAQIEKKPLEDFNSRRAAEKKELEEQEKTSYTAYLAICKNEPKKGFFDFITGNYEKECDARLEGIKAAQAENFHDRKAVEQHSEETAVGRKEIHMAALREAMKKHPEAVTVLEKDEQRKKDEQLQRAAEAKRQREERQQRSKGRSFGR